MGNSAGDGTGGAGVYDPYAGAAPLRGGDAGGARPDDAALAALIAALRADAAGAGGRFTCELVVAPSGRVDAAQCTRLSGGLTAQSVAAALRQRLLYAPADNPRRLTLTLIL